VTSALSLRGLNRALLARQLLLDRVRMPAAQAIEHLVGLQAQIPQNPYVALWSRLEDFDPGELSRLIADRGAVRFALMRSTIHLVTDGDAVSLRPVLQPHLERRLHGTAFGKAIAGMDLEALVAAGREELEREPTTFAELGRLLQRRWPDRDPTSMGYAIRELVPLVQVTPRGLWNGRGRALHTTAESWLGRPLAEGVEPEPMIRRYLGGFGPATVADIQAWSGLTGVREAIEPLRPALRILRDERGRELLDIPGGPLPDPETPAPVRFLPDYDNVLLAHADRARILDPAVGGTALIGKPTVLLDGSVAATWKLGLNREQAELKVEPLRTLSKQDRDAVATEGERLLELIGANARARRQLVFM
jgi:hypothetical protein